MVLVLIYGLLFLVYLAQPKYIKVAIFLLNLIIPDPIPYIDEFLMILPLIAPND